LIDEADVDLVHESGWLQRMAGGFAPHLSGGHAPEIIVDEWDELVERVLPAIACRKEQLRNPGHLRGARLAIGCPEQDRRLPEASQGAGDIA
jgi:hypothetical protein